MTDNGKECVYTNEIAKIANREKVELTIELDDVSEFDEDLSQAIASNTQRYIGIFSDTVSELIPDFQDNETSLIKDTLDVYIEHRLLAEQRKDNGEVDKDAFNK